MGHVVSEPAQTPIESEYVPSGPVLPPELPPGYVWVYPAPPEPPWKAPRLLIVATCAWILVLLVGAVFYAFHGRSTVREQSTIAGAQPVVSRAVVDVVTAAGSGPVLAMTAFQQARTCSITPVRAGVDYQRTLVFYVADGTEAALLTTIGAGLPASYRATTGPGAIAYLYADAGDFVAVVGAMTAPGRVVVRFGTGCRPAGHGIAVPMTSVAPSLPVIDVLTALKARPSATTETRLDCGRGRGTLRTVTATVPPGQVSAPLDVALGGLSPTPIDHTEDLFVYRTGSTDMVVRSDTDGITVQATTRCDS